MFTRDTSKHILEARGAIGFDQKFKYGLINSQLLFLAQGLQGFCVGLAFLTSVKINVSLSAKMRSILPIWPHQRWVNILWERAV
jgi:hypothetical protein|tara:strand:+ start:130 stop:381 length:252 start_codon:yes stop_codon:yes gene_type:complete